MSDRTTVIGPNAPKILIVGQDGEPTAQKLAGRELVCHYELSDEKVANHVDPKALKDQIWVGLVRKAADALWADLVKYGVATVRVKHEESHSNERQSTTMVVSASVLRYQ